MLSRPPSEGGACGVRSSGCEEKKARGSFGFGPKSDAPATMHRRRRSVAQMAHSARRRSCHVRLFFGSNTSWVHCLAKASQAGFLQEHLLVRGSHEPACKVGKP